MKLTKLSLVAALLIGSSAFAIENTKFTGDAKLFYATDDSDYTGSSGDTVSGSLFDKNKASGQAKLGLGVTTDLADNVKGNANLTVLSTLGLENQLVMDVWEATNGVDDSFWLDTLNISADLGKTNVTVGRMQLDTPLVFTETWSIAYNTFEAAVIANTDLPDTTIVAAYVGGANDGLSDLTGKFGSAGGYGNVIGKFNANGTTNFHQFYNGAYTVGAINNSWKPLNVQAWYYNATSVLNAYWAQADLDISGIQVGAQYTGGETKANVKNSAFALKAGYEMKDTFAISAAYSQTGKDSASGANLSGQGQSKLYTETWWSTGNVAQQDVSAMNLTVTSPVAGLFDFGLYYTAATQNKDVQTATSDLSFSELTLEFAKSFGALDTTLAYINTTNEIAAGKSTGVDAINTVQVYLTYNF